MVQNFRCVIKYIDIVFRHNQGSQSNGMLNSELNMVIQAKVNIESLYIAWPYTFLFLAGSTPSTPVGAKQLKTESGSPAAFSITTEGGMLQTLLHAIELKNQEAATDKDDDKRSKVGLGEVTLCTCRCQDYM